ncbi:hypothetical protein H9Y04_26200 [Streptomyces sp. TRM66268-LWL]|uniref:Uncharacterized protein n=1 Tax=Streptomyces polyasparticus TaxID=2767826 RepID=A0ABR7SMB7_9ACTN|nr:hypothetical protein [Streptomyces polyasparticus]MBC9716039.1 hypothetical protein [Streptomyces polyasparticus]
MRRRRHLLPSALAAAGAEVELPVEFEGSWQYWNVPALAPGASWSTSLPLTIASTQTAGTALLHIRTGISDTRWAVVVK